MQNGTRTTTTTKTNTKYSKEKGKQRKMHNYCSSMFLLVHRSQNISTQLATG